MNEGSLRKPLRMQQFIQPVYRPDLEVCANEEEQP
jgi:hypothetical protein